MSFAFYFERVNGTKYGNSLTLSTVGRKLKGSRTSLMRHLAERVRLTCEDKRNAVGHQQRAHESGGGCNLKPVREGDK